MPQKRNDEKALKLYALYQEGLPLREVGKQFSMSSQAVHKIFKRRGWPCRKKPKVPHIQFNNHKYGKYGEYWKRTDRKANLLHRDVWDHYNGPIPKGLQIHHKDGNKENNEITNLELMRLDAHTKIHLHKCPVCGYQF